MPAIWEIKRNWNTYWLWKTFVITEDMVSVSTDSTKWVAPYNESYWYTNITIDDTKWIVRMEWAVYVFVINTSMVVASAYRNVRVRIWTNWNRKPMMSAWNSILAWSSYFTKARTDVYVYKKTNQSWWALHLNNDTSYSAMSVSEWKTGTATSSRVMRADYLKQIIKYHAVDDTAYANTWNWITDVAPSKNAVYDKISAMDTTISWKADSSAIPTKVSQLTNDSWYTSNTWTITWITMNGSSKWTSGVVDLWTVITDVSWKANTSDVLTKTNTTAYTPTANYHPATKKYVDDAIASAWWWNMECLTTFWTKWRFWTKAMFKALPSVDVNGVYVILSQRDYNKMIQD